MKLSKHRANQLERTIRKLRSHPDLWCGDPQKEARITAMIVRVKSRLFDYWDRTRPDVAGQRLLQMYA